MKSNLLSKANDYFIGALVLFFGLIYNVLEQDFFGATAFAILSVLFLLVGVVKYRKHTR